MSIPDGIKPFTVSALTTAVKARIEEFFASAWVTGEVSNYKRATSGHVYFTLKDERCQLRCMMPRGFHLRLRFEPKDGMAVIVRGGLTVYEPRGEYQLIAEELHPKGIGAAELALRQLKEKLLAKGYFDPTRKRPLPRFPKRVALVASATGAAVRDMLELLAQRWPVAQVVVYPSRVQGDGAAENVAANLRFLSQLHVNRLLPLDAVVIGRGGGSAEDLWAFNEEIVADAIFECAVPVVSAVGHETDVTVADLVADRRAETPSAAIVALVPDRRELLIGLEETEQRIHDAMTNRVRISQVRLNQLVDRSAFRQPLQRIRELEAKLRESSDRLLRAARYRLERGQSQVAALAEQLEALSPLGVLQRGYSLTRRGDGVVVRSSNDVAPGEVLTTRLAEGEILSRVLSRSESDRVVEERP
jgi:exodeoxyribonuclease VII large subunit